MDKPKSKITTIYGTIERRKLGGENVRWGLARSMTHNKLANSYKEAEDLINQGQVKVNGKTIKDKGYALSDEDISQEDKIIIQTEKYRLELTA